MKKKKTIYGTISWVSFVVAIESLAYYIWIQTQQHSIIHNMERDEMLERNESYMVVSMIIAGFILLLFLVLLFILNHKKTKESVQMDQTASTGIIETPVLVSIQDPLREALRDEFSGPEDCIYLKLKEDIQKMIKIKRAGLQSKMGRVAFELYYPEGGEHAKITDETHRKMSFKEWLVFFFEVLGVQTPLDNRPSHYKDVELYDEIPMKYLFAQSWEEFRDEFKVKKYTSR